jgi:hypothetical protein
MATGTGSRPVMVITGHWRIESGSDEQARILQLSDPSAGEARPSPANTDGGAYGTGWLGNLHQATFPPVQPPAEGAMPRPAATRSFVLGPKLVDAKVPPSAAIG